MKANQKFYELFSKFREMYSTVEKLEENKASKKSYLAELTSKYQELPGKWSVPSSTLLVYLYIGTLEELESRAEQFEGKINVYQENKRQEERKMEDLEEDLNRQTLQQRSLIDKKGRLIAEAEVKEF